ncbi:cell division FtsA domain-containing protein [Fusibacter tunisiensis]|uniref:Cell division protein FtsA n=1 Tax=Fusibacter tunisiensis TaxID=1008308 RepID=A0ABS2MNV7_9FIRM|nr:cell division FtsA domain-containing protein [Fusibacter tunisiensis]MBM7561079.1 cell division protein FtsA [Fusibacter tunisiensis]
MKLESMPKNIMFALDIGTRSVVGVLSKKIGKDYVVVDFEVLEHPERAMFDGQIHDIQKVTDVVMTVVSELESRNGYKIERAAIAAAGRALKTERARSDAGIDVTVEIDKALVESVEMQAIQLAQSQLSKKTGKQSQYYCVGYSVVNYFLDDAMILNPLGHRGGELGVEIIATFLPHIVVDSLYSVVHKAGLEVMNLTLEPIAAMNVAIPKNLRLLNLALVDVGAGTSDIAISKEGTVVSYGMVSLAGDEITEKIAQTYLLDFNRAEKLKVELNQKERHEYMDILGLKHEITTEQVMRDIREVVRFIATQVAQNLLELNQKAPSAVFCIGGGSQIPFFTEDLAESLGLPMERVAIKAVDQLPEIVFESEVLKGPEFMTPIGIGVTAFEERDHDFIRVNVNETSIRLLNTKPLKVADALLLAGISARNLISERGDAMQITLNGEIKELKGDYGDPAKILLNGGLSALDEKISHKDQIVVIPATKGSIRSLELKELVNYEASISINGQKIKCIHAVEVNGVAREGIYKVMPGDVIETKGIKTVNDLAELMEIDLMYFHILNGDTPLRKQDSIRWGEKYYFKPIEKKAVETPVETPDGDSSAEMTVFVNEKPVEIPIGKIQPVFVDVFNYIDFDLTKPQGILNLRLNGERALYTDVLNPGDRIEINWKK